MSRKLSNLGADRPHDATPLSRRGFLQLGMLGLSLPGLMRLRAATSHAAEASSPRGAAGERTAVIVLFCHGGVSHIDTYDPKPDAPEEFRGPYRPIATRAPGIFLSELLPRHAAVADKFCLLRSMSHQAGCHANGPQMVLTGHYTPEQKWHPDHPDCLAIANYLRWQPGRTIPNYVGLTTAPWMTPVPAIGPAYLGNMYAPFAITNDPGQANFRVELEAGPDGARLPVRRDLLTQFDRAPRNRATRTMDSFHEQALNLLSTMQARRAFDLEQEPARLRDKYGSTGWGQQCLLARRLVEAGVDLVTVTLSGREAGGAANWDDHAVNCHIFNTLPPRALIYDRCVSALIEDLYDRGLDRRVLLIVTGEFGRTPRISYAVGTGSGVRQPGRDHWPAAMSVLVAGGGIQGGQVIGATNRLAEHPVRRQVTPRDFLATIYQHLGIDAHNVHVPDTTGRPMPILPEGAAIPELIGRG